MSGISGVVAKPVTPSVLAPSAPTAGRAPDGDTAAQEAAESGATKIAEAQNGGYAPAKHVVNKLA